MLKEGSYAIVKRFDGRQHIPVRARKAGRDKKTPDRGDSTKVLRMIEHGKRKVAICRELVPESITVEDTQGAQMIEHRPI